MIRLTQYQWQIIEGHFPGLDVPEVQSYRATPKTTVSTTAETPGIKNWTLCGLSEIRATTQVPSPVNRPIRIEIEGL